MDLIREYELVITAETDLKKKRTPSKQKTSSKKILFCIFQRFMKISLQKMHDHGKNFWNTCNGHRGTKKRKHKFKSPSRNRCKIFFKQLFDDNFFHADMHPGNIFVNNSNPENPTYVAVDYAICGP